MIAGKLLKRMVLLIGLAGLVISAAPQSDATALQPDLGYDLLFLATPPVRHHSPPPYPVHLLHLDTATGDVTLLDITDRPVSRNALSPDGQHLAVIRGERLCLVDRAWETQFCLPPGSMDMSTLTDPMGLNKIYWSPDSQSFWVPIHDEDRLGVAEIRVSDGSTLTVLSLERGERVTDFSPINRISVIDFGGVYDMDTRTLLFVSRWAVVSPRSRQAAEALTQSDESQEILLIVDLGDEERHHARNVEWATWVGPDNTWSDAELPLQPSSVISPEWSHDGRKIAVQLGEVFPPPPGDGGFEQSTTAVYFLDTQELRFLSVDDARGAHLVWSPDDTVLARVLIHETGMPRGLSIATLDGEVYPVSIEGFFPPVEDPLYVSNFYTITWLPRGWLDVDALAARSAEEAAR